MATSFLARNIRKLLGSTCLLRPSVRLVSHDTGVDGFEFKSTSLDILNRNQDVLFVDTYSELGFRLNNGMQVMGPCVLFPRTVLQWNVSGVEDINEKSLSLFYMLEPKLDILVLGIGDQSNRLDLKILQFMRSKKINMEVLPTDQALSTFNFLNSEGRYVAGAFIPPSYLPNEFSGEIMMIPGTDPYSSARDYDFVDDSNPELPKMLVDDDVDERETRRTPNVDSESDKKQTPKPDM